MMLQSEFTVPTKERCLSWKNIESEKLRARKDLKDHVTPSFPEAEIKAPRHEDLLKRRFKLGVEPGLEIWVV
jgi:hypothetical protein